MSKPVLQRAPKSSYRGRRRRVSALSLVVAFVAWFAVVVSPVTAQASTTVECGYSDQYVSALAVEYLDDGSFKIHLTPTLVARASGPTDGVNGWNDITVDMWHAAQSCVPNLYGSLADSIWQQMQCHVWCAPIEPATGPTYGSWHHPLQQPGGETYRNTHCLNFDSVVDGVNARYWDVQEDPYGNIG